MSWLLLLIAGTMELVFVLFLEKAHSQNQKGWLVISVGAMIVSILLLGKVTMVMPLGVAYAVWTGIGSVLSVGYGILKLGESKRPIRLFFVLLIVCGVVGLRLFG